MFYTAGLGDSPAKEEAPRAQVREDGAAYRAGMRTGDELLEMDGVPIRSVYDLREAIPGTWHRDPIELKVRRKGEDGEERLTFQVRQEPVKGQRMVGIQALSHFVKGVRNAGPGRALPGADRLLQIPTGAALVRVNDREIIAFTDLGEALATPLDTGTGLAHDLQWKGPGNTGSLRIDVTEETAAAWGRAHRDLRRTGDR